METKDFKRNVYKTLTVKASKEGMRSVLRKGKTVNIVTSILNTKIEVGGLMDAFQPYILGYQINDAMKAKGIDSLGNVLHHAVAAAKILKVKVPPAQRKIKPKNTATWLLMEIDKLSTELVRPYLRVLIPKAIETVVKTKKDKATGKETNVQVSKIVPTEFDTVAVSTHLAYLLGALYEFVWAVYHEPVAKVFEKHIEGLKATYPKDFFAPPPKKPGPPKAPKAKKAGTPAPTKAASA